MNANEKKAIAKSIGITLASSVSVLFYGIMASQFIEEQIEKYYNF